MSFISELALKMLFIACVFCVVLTAGLLKDLCKSGYGGNTPTKSLLSAISTLQFPVLRVGSECLVVEDVSDCCDLIFYTSLPYIMTALKVLSYMQHRICLHVLRSVKKIYNMANLH